MNKRYVAGLYIETAIVPHAQRFYLDTKYRCWDAQLDSLFDPFALMPRCPTIKKTPAREREKTKQ